MTRGSVTCASDLGRYLWRRLTTWSSDSRSASSPRCWKASRRTSSTSGSTWSSYASASSISRRATVKIRTRISTAWQRRSCALKKSFAKTAGRTTTCMSGVKSCAQLSFLPWLVATFVCSSCWLLPHNACYYWILFWNKITRRIQSTKFKLTQLLAQTMMISKKSKYSTSTMSKIGLSCSHSA